MVLLCGSMNFYRVPFSSWLAGCFSDLSINQVQTLKSILEMEAFGKTAKQILDIHFYTHFLDPLIAQTIFYLLWMQSVKCNWV